MVDTAVVHRNLQMVKWLVAEGCPWDKPGLMVTAALTANLELMQYVRAAGCTWSMVGVRCLVSYALECRDMSRFVPFVRWMRADGCPWSGRIVRKAMAGGRKDVVQWLKAEGDCSCPEFANMIVPELKNLLRGVGLRLKGKKADLVDRLENWWNTA